VTRNVAILVATLCFMFTSAHYATLLLYAVLSGRLMREHRAGRRPVALAKTATDSSLPGVSIIMPAYNEESGIVHSTISALAQGYPHVEVVVVNDGSRDGTVRALIDHFGLEPFDTDPRSGPIPTEAVHTVYRSRDDQRIVVVDKAPAGAKADAANAGINVARYPWVVVMDADQFLEHDTLTRLMVGVVAAPDEIVAVGGTLLPANDLVVDGSEIIQRRAPSRYWVGCQTIEYLTAFFVARPGLARLGAMPIVSGGFGLFRRDALLAVDGYRAGHLGEDLDMVLRMQRVLAERGEAHRMMQVPESICWTEFPSTKTVLRRQRLRWHRGLHQVMRDHRSMIGRRRYGRVGTVGVGSLWLFEWIGPLLEAVGWVFLAGMLWAGWVDPSGAMAVLLATQFFGMVVTMMSVTMASRHLQTFRTTGDLLRLMWWSVALNWGYRHLTLLWRLRSLLPGAGGWGDMPRVGLTTRPAPVPAP
jgi:cellulose synthase/poly-beta-1,6-N-acetylglucosamine synthase-like glycosyltransferase